MLGVDVSLDSDANVCVDNEQEMNSTIKVILLYSCSVVPLFLNLIFIALHYQCILL